MCLWEQQHTITVLMLVDVITQQLLQWSKSYFYQTLKDILMLMQKIKCALLMTCMHVQCIHVHNLRFTIILFNALTSVVT